MELNSSIRDVYFDEELERILINSKERNLLLYLEEEVLRKINNKQNFICLLKRYFDFLKKEKKYDEFLLIMENIVIIKKEASEKLKIPILKISDFYDKENRKLLAKEHIFDIVHIKYFNQAITNKNENSVQNIKEYAVHKDWESEKKERLENDIKEISNEDDTDKLTNNFEKINIVNNLDITENNLSKSKAKIRGRGNFMWISQTEIEDEESLEIMEKLNLKRKLEDEELENFSNNPGKENSKQTNEKIKFGNKIEFLEKEKEIKLQKRNTQLIKFCNENIMINKKKNDHSYSEYDKYFDYFFKDPKKDNSNKKINQYDESILPKVDHIFCVYDILLNNKQDYNSDLEPESLIEEKLSELMFEYTKQNVINIEEFIKDEKDGYFSMNNIIELQTNKIYIIIAENLKNARYLMKELSDKINKKIKQYKIDFLANSPDSIKIGKKIPKPNVAVLSRMINSHLKSNFSKNK